MKKGETCKVTFVLFLPQFINSLERHQFRDDDHSGSDSNSFSYFVFELCENFETAQVRTQDIRKLSSLVSALELLLYVN